MTGKKTERHSFRPVADLIPYIRNSRTHSKAQIAQIVASMQEFGFTNAVLADDKGIIAGHGRTLAADYIYSKGGVIYLPPGKVDGGEALPVGMVPVTDCSGWGEPKRKAYIIADNQLALNAGYDLDMLKLEIADLGTDGFDLGLLGFDENMLASLTAPPEGGLTDPEDVPATPIKPVTVKGDVWIMGKHRLVCGDATSADDVAKALNGVVPHLMVTDPPYGVEYDAGWRGDAKNGDGSALSTGKDRAVGKVKNDDKADWTDAWALFPGEVAYVWHAMLTAHAVSGGLIYAGFDIRAQIVWAKSALVISRGHYHSQHESAWYAVRKGKTGHWHGDKKQTTLWHIDKPNKSETGHSTQKPVECMKRPMENNSSPGQAVYEPSAGAERRSLPAKFAGARFMRWRLSQPIAMLRCCAGRVTRGKQRCWRVTGGPMFSCSPNAPLKPRWRWPSHQRPSRSRRLPDKFKQPIAGRRPAGDVIGNDALVAFQLFYGSRPTVLQNGSRAQPRLPLSFRH